VGRAAIRLERLTEATVGVPVGVDGARHRLGGAAQEAVLEDPSFEQACMCPQEPMGSLEVHGGLLVSDSGGPPR